MTVEAYNGTPAQSQVERDKTVATNESSSEKKGGVEFPWRKGNHFAFQLLPVIRGCCEQILIATCRLFGTKKERSQIMRSAKEAGCFPYRRKTVCYMEVFPNGDINQLSTRQELKDAFYHAVSGKSKIVAVWPGQWRSDLFIIDDLEEFYTELALM